MEQFVVVPAAWTAAGRGVGDASSVLADGVDAFCLALGGGSPFGTDDLGRAVFEGDRGAGSGFVGLRDGLLTDLAWTVNFLRGMAEGLVASGGVYVETDGTVVDQLDGRRTPGAEDLPSGVPGKPGTPGTPGTPGRPGRPGRPGTPVSGTPPEKYVPRPVPGGLPVTTPEPSVWKHAAWVLEAVAAGSPWPDGDLDGVAAWCEAARTMGRVVEQVADLVGGHARHVSRNNEGAATEAFTSTARRVHGEAGLLASLAARCEQLAQYCEHGGDAIVRARWQCLPSALFVVALMRYGKLLGTWAEVSVLPLIRLEGLALQIALRMIRQAVLGMAYSLGLGAIGQFVRWDGFHPGELMAAAAHGAFVGGFMGFAHAGLPALAGRSPALATVVQWMESPGARGVVTRFVVGGSVGTAAMSTASVVSGHGWDLAHAAETGFGMAFVGAGTELAGRAYRPRPTPPPGQQAASVSRWISPDGILDAPDRATPYRSRDELHAQGRAAALRAVLDAEGLYSFPSEAGRHVVVKALGDAYDAARETIAPFYVRAAHQMLPDLRVEAARGATIALLGRDAQNIGAAIRHLDPALYEQCVEIRINRDTIANALADLERHYGRTFPELAEMLGKRDWTATITPESITDAARNLTTHLRGQGLPVDTPDPPHDIILVDNGVRGTTRAALKQIYWPDARDTLLRGFYLFRAEAQGDPQPNADRGYLFDLDAAGTGGNSGNLAELPDDPRLEGSTFRNEAALTLLEELSSGPEQTPDRIDADGHPVQRLVRDAPLMQGLNPARQSERYLDPAVHEGVLRTIREAIGDSARFAALSEQRGEDVQELLRPGHERMVRDARAWATGDLSAMHPKLRELAGTYCWTSYWPAILDLGRAIDGAGLSAESARPVWAAFDELRDDAARAAFVTGFRRDHLPGSDPAPGLAKP